jgi:hypothetical protein
MKSFLVNFVSLQRVLDSTIEARRVSSLKFNAKGGLSESYLPHRNCRRIALKGRSKVVRFDTVIFLFELWKFELL